MILDKEGDGAFFCSFDSVFIAPARANNTCTLTVALDTDINLVCPVEIIQP